MAVWTPEGAPIQARCEKNAEPEPSHPPPEALRYVIVEPIDDKRAQNHARRERRGNMQTAFSRRRRSRQVSLYPWLIGVWAVGIAKHRVSPLTNSFVNE